DKSYNMPGTMEKLLMFYGDIIRDGPFGVDVSRCRSKRVFVKDMVNTGFMDVKRCIQAEFGPETVGKNMVVKAFVIVGRVDGTPARWGLRQVNGDLSWGSYMRFATTPGNSMYGRPMVYVRFVDAGVLRLTTTGGAHTQSVAPMGGNHVREEGVVVPTVNPGPYPSVVVDHNESAEVLSDELDHGDYASGSSDDSDDEEGGDPSQPLAIQQRAVVPSTERWTDSDIARHDAMIRDMRGLLEIVLEGLRMVPPLPHSEKAILIRIYERVKEFIELCSRARINGIVWSALPGRARPSLTTSMDHETGTRQDSVLLRVPASTPLQRSQFGGSQPERQFGSGAMEVDNPSPDTSPGRGPTGQCSYDQGQGSDGDESTDVRTKIEIN
uniref:Uncharacterized protein n=2 Tax=Aegilops tauschii subsp. strangulata TaxID=200361 RepID=A0A453GPG2_AEGTS